MAGGNTCKPCGNLGSGSTGSTTIDTDGNRPTSPTTADYQLYITSPVGPVRVNNQTGTGGGVGGGEPRPNSNGPRVVTVSWREIF